MNMQIFSLAGTLFSPSLRSEPLCPRHSSAEGAGLKGTFCQGRYFCLLVVWAVGSVTLISQDGPGVWPLLSGAGGSCVVVPAGGSSTGSCCIAAPDIQRLSDWPSTAKGEIRPVRSWTYREHRLLKIKLVKLQSNFTCLAYLSIIIFSQEAVLS